MRLFTNLSISVTLFSLLLHISFTSCKGQNTADNKNKNIPAQTTAGINTIGTAAQSIRNIRSVLQDKNGNYWFGSDGSGVYRYDGKSLILFTHKDGLCNDQVGTIQEDKRGNIWFGTGNNICCYDGSSFSNFNKARLIGLLYSPEVWHKEPGDLWFSAGAHRGLYRYNGDSFYNYQFPGAELESRSSSLPYDQYDIYCTLVDRSGNIWLGTQSKGVCRFDGKDFTWFRDKGLADAAVRVIFQDKTGNLWFGNNGYGLFRYDGKSLINVTDEKRLANHDFVKNMQGKEGTLARVWSINENTSGDLWIGTIDAGAWRYDGKTMTNYPTIDGLTDYGITTIYKDKKGELWFGTAGDMYKFNEKNFTKFAFK